MIAIFCTCAAILFAFGMLGFAIVTKRPIPRPEPREIVNAPDLNLVAKRLSHKMREELLIEHCPDAISDRLLLIAFSECNGIEHAANLGQRYLDGRLPIEWLVSAMSAIYEGADDAQN